MQGPDSGWNYPDGLFVGKGGMTDTEYRTMFALWCIVKSPLMLGSDLRTITRESETYQIITNQRLLDINQDRLGVQARCVKDCCSHQSTGGLTSPYSCHLFSHSWQVWAGPLADQAWVVLILNRFDKEISLTMDWHTQALIPLGTYQVEDLWSGLVVANITAGGETWEGSEYTAIMQPHQNLCFKLSPL